MKMTYKNLSSSEFEQSLKSLSPGVKDFEVELSLDGNAPETLHTGSEKMSLDNILELVEKQGFKVNDVDAVTSEGKWSHCVGVSLNKPFIHDKTKEDIEGLFILGNAYDKAITTSLYSFLIHAESSTRSINFSIDILAKSKDDAKDSFFKKIAELFIHDYEYNSRKRVCKENFRKSH